MVQIPTAADIQRASANSGRVAPQASGGYAGQALSNLGKSIVSVAFDLNDLATQERADQINSRSNDVSTAMQRFIADEDQRYNEARDKASASGIGFTREYLTGYQQRANDFAKANFEGLAPNQQTEYLNTLLSTGNQIYAKANSFEGARKTDYFNSNTNTALDGIRTRIRSNAAPFADLKAQGLEAINSAPMDEAWKMERRKAWESDAAESKVQWDFERDPVGTIDKLKTPVGGQKIAAGDIPPEGAALLNTIAGTESGGAYDIMNGGERFSSFADHPRRVGKGGTATAAGRYQFVKGTWDRAAKALGLTDFSPASQDKAAWWLAQSDYKAKTGRDLLSDLKSPDANVQAGIRRTLSSTWEGLKSLGDGKFAEDVKKGGSLPYDPAYDGLSYDRRETLLNQAQRDYGTSSRVAISNASDNAFTAIQNTGIYTGQLPNRDQFNAAFGAEGGQKYDQFQQALQTSQQIYAMRLMPAAQIKDVLDNARPQSTGDTAAADQKTYDTLTKAADATLKARDSDPAGYVQQTFPQVRTAFQQAHDAAGSDGQSEAYRNAINVSMAAQRELGVANPQPLPKEMVKAPVDTFKDERLPADQRIAAVAGILNATNDPRQKAALFDQMVKAGLPDITEGAFNAMARGDTGAANRLFEAAMIDPSKLPGKSPEKPDDIRSQIQSDVMDAGQVGDIYYGLSDGSTDNLMAAQRDAKLLSNAVEIRVRKGESLDDAISGAAKDLYGDVKPVEGDSRVNAHVLIPSAQDEGFVLDGLHSVLPDVKSALETQFKATSAAPSGEFKGMMDAGNIDLAARPVVKNADGTISTVRSMSFEEDGKEVLIPTVSPDGKVLSDEAAIDLYHKTGQFLGKFDTPDHADAYAQALHEAQARFYEGRASGINAIADSALMNRIDDIMSNGYFRNMGDGYAFFDGYTGTAVSGPDGKPLIFHEGDFKAPEKPKAQIAPAWPGERAGNYVGSLVKPAPSAQKPNEQQMPAQPTPDQILSGQDSVFGAR